MTDAYAAPVLDNVTDLLEGTRLRETFNVTQPDLVRKADFANEDGDYWHWQFPTSFILTAQGAYQGMIRAYLDPGNGTLRSVRVLHTWNMHASPNATGLTWNVQEAKAAKEAAYRADLATLMPEVERVRAALAPRLGDAPAQSREDMLWSVHREGCV